MGMWRNLLGIPDYGDTKIRALPEQQLQVVHQHAMALASGEIDANAGQLGAIYRTTFGGSQPRHGGVSKEKGSPQAKVDPSLVMELSYELGSKLREGGYIQIYIYMHMYRGSHRVPCIGLIKRDIRSLDYRSYKSTG